MDHAPLSRARKSISGIATAAVIVALLTLAGGTPATAAMLSEAEPNGTLDTANQLPLGATIQGTTFGDATADKDYFTFDVPADGRVTIDLRFPSGLPGEYAYEVGVFTPARSPEFRWALKTAHADGAYLRDQAVFLNAGRYSLMIVGAPTLSTWGEQYSLTITSSPGFVESVHNNRIDMTDELPLATTIQGSTLGAVPSDEDWYAFEIPENSRAAIDLRFPAGLAAGPAYRVAVYDVLNGRFVYGWDVDSTQFDGSTIREQGVFLHAGKYRLSLTGRSEWAAWGVPYSLTVTGAPGFVESEPNYESAGAVRLPLATPIQGSSLTTGDLDDDYYAIDMPTQGALQVGFTFPAGLADTDAYAVTVFRGDGTQVSDFPLTGAQSDGKHLRSSPVPLPAGRAFIRIRGMESWPSWGATYTLSSEWVPTPQSTVTRLAGADRYETSLAISRASFEPGVSVAYISGGLDFPDALAGAPVAAMKGAPILLVRPTSVPSSVSAELKRLKPKRIVVLGGAGVVSEKVRTTLEALTGGSVTRLAGSDRYATAVAISRASFKTSSVAYLANGSSFPDALSGASVAGIANAPVLLVKKDSIPPAVQAELLRLEVSEIILLGGSGAISDRAWGSIDLPGPTSGIRLFGTDRYGTSAEISRFSFPKRPPVAYIANGRTFPDALSGAAVAGLQKGPVLLVAPGSIPTEVKFELQRLKPRKIVVLGGTGAVSERVKTQLAQFVVP